MIQTIKRRRSALIGILLSATLFSFSSSLAQGTVTGIANVAVGQSQTYTLNASSVSSSFFFLPSGGGSITSQTSTTCTVLWQQTGNYSVVVSYNGIQMAGLNVTVVAAGSSPAAPTGVSTSNSTVNSFTLSWNSVPSAASYRVDVSADGTFGAILSSYNDKSVTGTSISVTGLDQGSYYTCRVRAVNASGTSPNSLSVSPYTLTEIPIALEETSTTASSFVANWSHSNGSSTSFPYFLDVSTSSSFGSYLSGYNNKAIMSTSEVISGLLANKDYYYRVRVAGANTSANSNVITAGTIITSPSVVQESNRTNTGFQANWNSVSGVTNYKLYVSTSSSFSSHLSGYNGKVVSGSNHTVTGLAAGKNYYYRLKSVGTKGDSGYSGSITANTTISVPTATGESNRTNTGFRANWNSVSGVTNYKLYVSTSSSFSSHLSGYNGKVVSGSNHTVTGLAAGKNYYYRLKSDGPNADSGYSSSITANTSITTPSANSASGQSNTSFVASWSVVSGVSNYLLYVSENSSFSTYEQDYNGKIITGTSHTVNNLTSGTTYYYKVRADGSDTDSGDSNDVQTNTLTPVPTTPIVSSNLCGIKTLTRLTTPGHISWYWQGTNSSSYSETNTNTTYSASSSGTYYIRAKSNDGYWSASVPVSVTVNNTPSTYTVSGGGDYCEEDLGKTINLSGSQLNVSYYLQRDGSTVTSEPGTGSALSFTNVTASGNYTIYGVYTATGCQQSMAGSVNVTINPLPQDYAFTDGDENLCADVSVGPSITLAGSEAGIRYQLTLNDSPIDSQIDGTGGSITFGSYIAQGTYTVTAINYSTNCSKLLSASKTVTIVDLPEIYNLGGGGGYCEGTAGSTITLSGSQSGVDYQLKVNGANVGPVKAGNDSPISWSNLTTGGGYSIVATNSYSCVSNMNGILSVHMNPNPIVDAGSIASTFVGSILALSGGLPAGGNWSGSEISGNAFDATSLDPGTYTATYSYTDNNGCIGSNTRQVEVLQLASENENYVISTSFKTAGIDETRIPVDPSQVSRQISYFDELGRPEQTIAWRASPNQSDIIQSQLYDEFGRQYMSQLPYAEGNRGLHQIIAQVDNPLYPTSSQAQFYSNPGSKVASDPIPYAKTIYEASPRNLVIKQGAPGAAWQPDEDPDITTDKVVKYGYGSNAASEVKLWTLDESGLPVSSSTYTAGELSKTTITDEASHQVIEFTDKQGRTVLKKVQVHENGTTPEQWAETYYIYDDFGNLRYVLPPELNKRINDGESITIPAGYTLFIEDHIITDANNAGDSYLFGENAEVTVQQGVVLDSGQTIGPFKGVPELNDYSFQYKYDGRHRMIQKKVPGAGWICMVYDNRDRLVLTQDANQRPSYKWIFTKYDELNRPVATGTYNHGSAVSQLDMQAIVDQFYIDAFTNTDKWFEERGAAIHGYTDQSFPKNVPASEYLTVTYYDDYEWNTDSNYDYQDPSLTHDFNGVTYSSENAENTAIKGQVTGGLVKNLIENTWLKSVNYYDDRYRVIQTVGLNSLGIIDRYSNLYDFTGKVLQTKTIHGNGTDTMPILRTLDYDHADRVLSVRHKIDDQDEVILLSNEYNELGELVDKKLHSIDESTFEQSVDYRYNIRGWLTSMNNASLTSDANNDETDDYFGFELAYNELLPDIASTAAFNGNISAMKWSDYQRSAGANERAYAYSYDPMNRLLGGQHYTKGAGAFGTSNDYTVSGLQYDLNGNIQSLIRKGKANANMDDLAYSYTGNQLSKVEDTFDADEGFKDGADDPEEYRYDANGNMIEDKNKGIAHIEYNHLNLPQKVVMGLESDGNYIQYQYDAAGIKLAQEVYESNLLTKRTDYLGEFIYETRPQDPVNSSRRLQFIQHEEGRIVPDFVSGQPELVEDYVYQYHLKDHLGNTRATFTTKEYTSGYLATFEDINHTQESEDFHNIDPRVPYPVGGKAIRLNSSSPIGAGLALEVSRGDVIDMSVKAYYEDVTGHGVGALGEAAVLAALTGAFGGVSGGTEGQQLIHDVFNGQPAGALLAGGTGDDSRPSAYLNYLLLDQDHMMVDAGFFGVQEGANLEQTITVANLEVQQAGFIYIYVSNESNSSNYVFFDNLDVAVKESSVLETTDYYPFGLAFNEHSKTGMIGQKYKYNGKEEINDLGLNWHDYGARMYDYVLGRWHGIDAASDLTSRISPYVYGFDNPIRYIDPDGFSPEDIVMMAKYYLGTWYEYGGKNPFFVGGRGIETSQADIDAGLKFISLSIRTSQKLHGIVGSSYTGSMIPNSSIYDFYSMDVPQNYSFGIDCSGLAREAFNADEDKLMADLPNGASAQLRAFENAAPSEGVAHTNFERLEKGDLVFRRNSNGNAYHVMVATGKVIQKKGKVVEFEVIHAPATGDKVKTEVLSVEKEKKKNVKIGHTYRRKKHSEAGPRKPKRTTDALYSRDFLKAYYRMGSGDSK
ncbi:MAG: fibronectin type III domain-containing protein [Cyclobacteriaceae bacterium]